MYTLWREERISDAAVVKAARAEAELARSMKMVLEAHTGDFHVSSYPGEARGLSRLTELAEERCPF